MYIVSFDISTEDTWKSIILCYVQNYCIWRYVSYRDSTVLFTALLLFKQTNKQSKPTITQKNLFWKFVLAVLVLSLILPKTSQYIKWIVSAGLAQVSEFSFVLGSRARRAGIISREVYLLILSVTTLSLLLAPALWRAAIMKCVPRPERRSSTWSSFAQIEQYVLLEGKHLHCSLYFYALRKQDLLSSQSS